MVKQGREEPPENASRYSYGYFLVGTSFLMMSVIWGAYFSFGVFFNPVLSQFGWNRTMTSGASSLASIMSCILGIAVGGLTDRFGPRIVMTFCGLLIGLGLLMMSRMTAIWHFYLFFGVLVGAGMSGAFIPLLTTITRWFVKRRGIITGIVSSGGGIGILIGPPVASQLIALYGWRLSYAILGGTVLAVVVLSAQFIKRDPTQIGQVAYGANQVESKQLNSEDGGLSLKEVVRASRFWFFFATGICYGFCVFSIMVHIVPHAIEMGIPAIRAANILATIGALGIVGKVSLGRVGDLVGSRRTLILGLSLMSMALIWLVLANRPWMLFLIAGIFGFAYAGCAVSHSPLIAELFGLRSHGLIFGVFNISVMGGGAMGPLITGYLFDVTDSYRGAFIVCAAVSVLGAIAATLLKSTRGSKAQI